jgi:hypothetical protein
LNTVRQRWVDWYRHLTNLDVMQVHDIDRINKERLKISQLIINETKQEDQMDEYLSDDSDDNRDTKYNILDVDENEIEEEDENTSIDACNQLD